MSKKTLAVLLTIVSILLVGLIVFCCWYFPKKKPADPPDVPQLTFSFSDNGAVLKNPLMGFAVEADYIAAVADNTLVYVNLMWKDLEPTKGDYDFAGIEEKFHLKRWREEGKHLVLRFVCDYPGKDAHVDLPQWLYDEIGGDGTHYEMDGKYGFSPNYNNETLIAYHRLAVLALGQYFSQDSFLSYVELGSLGHWGEWHVDYEHVKDRIPAAAVRRQYILPYIEAFQSAKFLMRRPFNEAAEFSMGLYNDMAGHVEATEEWVDWIEHGGDYNQALEKNALTPMPDAYLKAPVGGELTSDYTEEYLLQEHAEQTAKLIADTHTTFLGPKCPVSENMGMNYTEGVELLLRNMGYRYIVEGGSMSEKNGVLRGAFQITNKGVAPMYFDWPVCLYLIDESHTVLKRVELDVKTTKILPGASQEVTFQLESPQDGGVLCIGIEDPMTGRPAVKFAMDTEQINGMSVLYTF